MQTTFSTEMRAALPGPPPGPPPTAPPGFSAAKHSPYASPPAVVFSIEYTSDATVVAYEFRRVPAAQMEALRARCDEACEATETQVFLETDARDAAVQLLVFSFPPGTTAAAAKGVAEETTLRALRDAKTFWEAFAGAAKRAEVGVA